MKKIKKVMSLILTLALSLGLASSLTACSVPEVKDVFTITATEENNLDVKLISSETSTVSESGYLTQKLTATVSPKTDYNQAVNWSVSWKNANSTWATGKAVSDYVEVVPQSEGSLTATVTCKQAFGEQVNVIVSSQQDSTKRATCVCDYAKRFLGFENVKFGVSEAVDNSFKLVKGYVQNDTITSTPIFSDYTYDVDFGSSEFTANLFLYQDFEDKLTSVSVGLDFTQKVIQSGFSYEDTNSIHKNEGNVVYVNAYNLFYSGNFLYGLMDVADRVSFNMGNHTKLNNLFNELGTNYDIGFIRIYYNYYYTANTYVDYPIYLDESVVNLAVSNVSLASNNIVF